MFGLRSVPFAIGLGTMGSVVMMGAIASAQAASLTSWHFDPIANELQLTVKEGTTPRYFLMAQPARIVVDLPDTSVGEVSAQGTYAGSVRQIRVSQFQPGLTRIVMELSPTVSLAPGQVKLQKVDGSRWSLRPLISQATATAPQRPNLTEPIPPGSPAIAATPVSPASTPIPQPMDAPVQTPLPPTATGSVTDDGVMVDTAGAVAIAVPRPGNSSNQSPTTAAAPVAPPQAPLSRQTNKPPSLPRVSSTTPLAPSAASKPTPEISDIPDIPTTLAFETVGKAPMVSVPPLDQSVPAPTPLSSTPLPPSSPVIQSAPSGGNGTLAPTASDSLPSTSFPGVDATPTITVPPLSPIASPQPGTNSVVVPTTSAAETLLPLTPSSIPTGRQAAPTNPPSVRVPPLQPTVTPARVEPLPSTPGIPPQIPSVTVEQRVVDFGQPLPAVPLSNAPGNPVQGVSGNPGLAYRPLPANVLLPAGSILTLRYPGEAALNLAGSAQTQEVLLLQTEIRDGLGNIVAPQNSKIIGRFETSTSGSRFVTQAISLGAQTIPIAAQSENLDGNRQVTDNHLVRNTGLGLLAGGLIGGLAGSAGWGVVGGAAAGAAATWLTAPKPATIQPGQIVQVRLVQDLQRP